MQSNPSAAAGEQVQRHTATLSVVIITYNEEANLGNALESVQALVGDLGGEMVVVDSGSTDRTTQIAGSFGAKVFVHAWSGFAAQRNWALEQATSDWILPLDADEVVTPQLAEEIRQALASPPQVNGYWLARKNHFLGRWMQHGGFYPDPKLRLFRRGTGQFENRMVHEPLQVSGPTATLREPLIHNAYPTLEGYIQHMNHYSSLGAQMARNEGYRGLMLADVVLRPAATFLYNYVVRLGFLDGREGLLLHLYHAAYVSWKYAKVWELRRAGRRDK